MIDSRALRGGNRFKLGLFGLNVDNACAITTIDGVFHPTWDNVTRLTRMADAAGVVAALRRGLNRFIAEVMPLVEQQGLRKAAGRSPA